MDAHKQAFIEEAYELLAELERSLLELEDNPGDMAMVGQVFRAMHTIKGSGAMFGFEDIAAFTHNVENVFDQVRSGTIPVTRELVNLTLTARDHIRELLDASVSGKTVNESRGVDIVLALNRLVPLENGGIPQGGKGEEKKPAPDMVTYRIRFKPHQDLLAHGTNPVLLLSELRDLGDCAVTAHTENIPVLEDMDPEGLYIFWDAVLTTDKGLNAVRDVFIFVEDDADITIETILDEDDFTSAEMPRPKLGEILLKHGDISGEALHQALGSQKRIGEILVEEKIASRASVTAALTEQNQIRKRLEQRGESAAQISSVRVPSEKLDHLVDLVGELVTVQARLSQKAAKQGDPDLVAIAEDVESLTSGLRDNAMSIRMLQIGTTFATFKRLVRDLSGELGKRIELTTAGGETELDKTVIDQLKDPLVHIIRNAVDHAIEKPEERLAAGKDATGTIQLSAEHSGAHVLIRIRDDGKGLDPQVIRKKAVEKGLIPADADLEENEIQNLIFAPGFSTAAAITDLSGRGVGMDVVKKSIENLRGAIDLVSRKGEGTTITLKLPLTLAIIDGLLVQIGEGFFVLPLSSVEECVELTESQRKSSKNGNILNIRGDIVPYVRLRDEYDIRNKPPALEHVVIMETFGKRVGFVVDRVIGGHQTVIKNLGGAFRDAKDISGATILGDGTVALIIDVNKIME